MKIRSVAVAAIAASLVLAACGDDADDAVTTTPATTPATTAAPATTESMDELGTIVDIASANSDFSTLVTAVAAAGLVETLSGEGPFTVFAPTNAAFDALPEGLLAALLLPENVDALTQVLTYHVVSGAVYAADVTEGDVPSVETSPIAVTIVGGEVILNDSATVVAADVMASNGVIHVIDAVLVPPTLDLDALMAMGEDDIVDVASGLADFTTLVQAVVAADLVETLQGEGPFTVFAPTNEAFAALPAGVVDALLLPENKDALVQILTYHVVSGAVYAADVTEGDVPSVETSLITVTIVDGKVVLNGSATVVATDVEASNGVIHVIDAVLLPPGFDPSTL